MSRIGCLILAAILLIVGGVWWLARRSGPAIQAPPAAVSTAASATPASSTPTAPIAPGSFVIPVNGVRPDQLADTWGDARGDGTRAHHAIDIVAPRGTPVVAAAGGTVEKIFESHDGGHTVYVRVGPAIVTYYAHLDAYAPGLSEGQRIGQGALIGTVGSTGDADPGAPHLHFEIKRMAPGDRWDQGTEIDPYPILARGPAAR